MSEPGEMLAINRAAWDHVATHFHGDVLPSYGPLAPTEDALRLLDARPGMRVLEVGCGSGRSLRYLAERGAAELWGLDLSPVQIASARDVLRDFGERVHLFESPMEVDPGIPAGYFDLVFSIYGLGWTVDLPTTLGLVAGYLKPGGSLVFSGEHPVYGCLSHDGGRYFLARPYAAEGSDEYASWKGARIVIPKHTLGTLVTEVARAGLRVEALIEGELDTTFATESHVDPARWYSIPRATMMPTTFIIRARKPGSDGPGIR